MYGRKIKYYRLKSGLTIDELANKLSLTKAAISQYENDKRDPDDQTLHEIAAIFGISWLKLLPTNDSNLKFVHYGFHKKMDVSQNEISILIEDIEERCKNQIETMNLLGILPSKVFYPKKLSMEDSLEANADEIRLSFYHYLDRPLPSITSLLENIGIIVITFDCSSSIDGLNGTVNKIPYIFFNSNCTVERQRFTLVHEFCHLFFNHLDQDQPALEKYINQLTGHVLMPTIDLTLNFGHVNHSINVYYRNLVAKSFKIAPSCLVTRLYEEGIVTKLYYTNFFKFLNAHEGRKNEKSLLSEYHDYELPTTFIEQVYRALSDNLISKSRAAELLKIPLADLLRNISEG